VQLEWNNWDHGVREERVRIYGMKYWRKDWFWRRVVLVCMPEDQILTITICSTELIHFAFIKGKKQLSAQG